MVGSNLLPISDPLWKVGTPPVSALPDSSSKTPSVNIQKRRCGAQIWQTASNRATRAWSEASCTGEHTLLLHVILNYLFVL